MSLGRANESRLNVTEILQLQAKKKPRRLTRRGQRESFLSQTGKHQTPELGRIVPWQFWGQKCAALAREKVERDLHDDLFRIILGKRREGLRLGDHRLSFPVELWRAGGLDEPERLYRAAAVDQHLEYRRAFEMQAG